MAVLLHPFSWERVFEAHRRVHSRVTRAVGALQNANIIYAMAGDHAASHWVGTVDASAARNNVDIVLVVNRADCPAIRRALNSAALIEIEHPTKTLFAEVSTKKPRDSVELLFEGEPVLKNAPWKIPSPLFRQRVLRFDVLNLDVLAKLFLSAHTTLDKVRLRDMIDVGLIDQTWVNSLPPELGQRLHSLLDTPEG